jgi:DNA-binding beta-propeller fold protein YncE
VVDAVNAGRAGAGLVLAVLLPAAAAAGPPSVSALTLDPPSPLATGTVVTFTATASDPDGDPLSFRWDFGDGTPQTAWLPGQSSIAHGYDSAGVFTILVQARDPGGAVAARATTLVVHEPVPASAPTRSSTVLVDTVRGRVWTANADHDSVSSFDLDLGDRVELPACDEPNGVALDAAGRLWVPCRGDDTVAVIDVATGARVATVELDWGAAPVAAAATPDGAAVWIAERGPGRVVRRDAATLGVTGAVAVGPDPSALALSADGATLLVSRRVSAGDSGTVHRIDALTPGATVAISLSLDSTSPDSGTAGRGLPNALAGLAVAPAGTRAWVVGKKDNVLRGQYREGTSLTFETTTRAIVAEIDLASSQEIVDRRNDVDDQSGASAIVASPLGSHLFVTFHGSRRLIAFVAASGAEATRVDVGLGPDGVAIDPATRRLYVHSGLDRSIRSFDAAALLDRGETVLPELAVAATVAVEALPAAVYSGKRIFSDARDPRMSQEGYLSCAACHADGGRDGRVWDFTQFGEGLRETTSLRGVGRAGRGLLHWTGNFDEAQDFETPIREHFGGTGLMSDAQYASSAPPMGPPKAGRSAALDALAAYVDSLVEVERSPHRQWDGSPSADGAAGRALFVTAGCVACHSGPSFTDSSLRRRHDVGTLGPGSGGRLGLPLDGLDTPSLLGVWATAPYLHDGSAATLEEVLTLRNPFDQHGQTAALSSTEIAQLVAFLLELDGAEPPFDGPGATIFADGFESGDTSAWGGAAT